MVARSRSRRVIVRILLAIVALLTTLEIAISSKLLYAPYAEPSDPTADNSPEKWQSNSDAWMNLPSATDIVEAFHHDGNESLGTGHGSFHNKKLNSTSTLAAEPPSPSNRVSRTPNLSMPSIQFNSIHINININININISIRSIES